MEITDTEVELLKDINPALVGIYLSWRLLNLTIEDFGLSMSTKYKYKNELKSLFGINVSKPRVQIQEVAL